MLIISDTNSLNIKETKEISKLQDFEDEQFTYVRFIYYFKCKQKNKRMKSWLVGWLAYQPL